MTQPGDGAPRRGMRSLILTVGPSTGLPWWWDEVKRDAGLCELRVDGLNFRDKTSKQVTALELPAFLAAALPRCLRLRHEVDYVYTFECSLATFALAFWQTLLGLRRPRHVVLQFIMREKTASLSSRVKYAFMRWCFRSLHLVVCSSTREADYYREAFGWPASKMAFVPYHSSAQQVVPLPSPDDGYILAAGRVFRDFPTLFAAVDGTSHPVTVVARRNAANPPPGVDTVRLLEDIPLAEFNRLMERCRAVVVPLHDMRISAGQVVLLHGMAAGKPVIATRTAGTIDYITDGENGLLVPPGDAPALRAAIDRVMGDAALRTRLGAAAQRTVLERHLPHHYTALLRAALQARA